MVLCCYRVSTMNIAIAAATHHPDPTIRVGMIEGLAMRHRH